MGNDELFFKKSCRFIQVAVWQRKQEEAATFSSNIRGIRKILPNVQPSNSPEARKWYIFSSVSLPLSLFFLLVYQEPRKLLSLLTWMSDWLFEFLQFSFVYPFVLPSLFSFSFIRTKKSLFFTEPDRTTSSAVESGTRVFVSLSAGYMCVLYKKCAVR